MFLTTDPGYAAEVAPHKIHVVNDASSWSKIALLRMALRILWIIIRTRPDVVLSTGAAPGYFAIRFSKLFGAETVWVDSIANAEGISRAGQLAKSYSDLWLTQWPHLAAPEGPRFVGNVL
jgi:hypothetical protein